MEVRVVLYHLVSADITGHCRKKEKKMAKLVSEIPFNMYPQSSHD